MNDAAIRAKHTRLCAAARTTHQAAVDFAFNNKPLTPAQEEEHARLVKVADDAAKARDDFYKANCKAAGGCLRC